MSMTASNELPEPTKSSLAFSRTLYLSPVTSPTPLIPCVFTWILRSLLVGVCVPVATTWIEPVYATGSAGGQSLNTVPEISSLSFKIWAEDAWIGTCSADVVGAVGTGGASHATTQAKAKAKGANRFMILPPHTVIGTLTSARRC